MSITPMDLDSSLEDLIKKRKNKPNNNNQKQQNGGKKQQQNNKPRPSIQVQTKAKVTKPQRHNSGINARLVNREQRVSIQVSNFFFLQSTKTGPLFTSKNQPQKQKEQPRTADPSQIIITKAIAPGSIQSRIGNNNNRVNKKSPSIENKSLLGGRLGKQQGGKESNRVETHIYQRSASPAVSNFSIRGRSNTVAPSQGLSIRGESGPTLVLVTGLDPGTNDDDVKVSL